MTHTPPGTPVAIGLGTNLGDRPRNLRHAIERLGGAMHALRCSTVWASDAMLLPGAPSGWAIPFLNAVVVGRTGLAPHALLDLLQRIERDLGRGPHEKWAPRTIDVDLLLHGDTIVDDTRLTLPHAGLTDRPFVLLPLAELWPERHLPGDPLTLAERATAYRGRHPEHLPFHAHPVDARLPHAAGA